MSKLSLQSFISRIQGILPLPNRGGVTKCHRQLRRGEAVLLFTLLSLAPSLACTNFLIGKNASADGSTMITYNQDSYGMYGHLVYLPAADHPAGAVRKIFDGDTNHYYGDIPEVAHTYQVVGYINEHQLAIMETTFGGRLELADTLTGKIDYVSLMHLALQRAKTAREAIKVMTDLVAEYGYASEGESFSIADPNEVWVMEMIGKGPGRKGAVWVAQRIPDDAICCHANQSRIHKFNIKDKQNVICSKDVIAFAREKGFFSGKDADFSFSAAYSPADLSSQRFCDARAWSFFNKWVDGMDRYLPFVDGLHCQENPEVMPLWFVPRQKLSLHDVMMSMRDHYEGTPFDVQNDLGQGPWEMPYRPTPLTFEGPDGQKYFNERPISTQQTAMTYIAQLRGTMPNAVGGVIWIGNDDPNMCAYTPIYCQTTRIPECYAEGTATDVTFSWKSAFWVENWVANMVYPRYSVIFPELQKERDAIEDALLKAQSDIEAKAVRLCEEGHHTEARRLLSGYGVRKAQGMLARWKKLGEKIIVKYNDMAVKKEDARGVFQKTRDGLAVPPERPGYPMEYRKKIIEETGKHYLQK